jgi:DNA-binding MarR family transcriptional regulator
MTDLADRALISRSGMTRRVARLVDVGLVRRANARLDDQELALLESALEKVTLDCTFG